MKKLISVIAACIGALVLAAGIALPSASADPTNAPSPGPTVANQPPDRFKNLDDDPRDLERGTGTCADHPRC